MVAHDRRMELSSNIYNREEKAIEYLLFYCPTLQHGCNNNINSDKSLAPSREFLILRLNIHYGITMVNNFDRRVLMTNYVFMSVYTLV